MDKNESDKHRTPNLGLAQAGGSSSPESLCEFASFAPVQASVKAPPAPSPCSLSTSGGSTLGKRSLKT